MKTAFNPFATPLAKAAPKKKPSKPVVKPPVVKRGDAQTERFLKAIVGLRFK